MFKNTSVTNFSCTLRVEWIKLSTLFEFSHDKDGYSLKGIELPGEAELRVEKPIWKLFENTQGKMCLLTLKLRSFRPCDRGENSAGKEFKSLAVQAKQLLK